MAQTAGRQPRSKSSEQAYEETLEVLGRALDLRDTETAGHSYRVQRYSVEIAGKMGCPRSQVNDIGRGARVHDIGKIGIPDSILLKPGKLNRDERDLMRTHCWLGYNLLRPVQALRPASEIVLAHHEKYDGRGYPYGLEGSRIPLGARVFSVADTLDAITTDRPYRRALPLAYAYQEIQRESGRQFDPQVVEVFRSIPESFVREIILSEKRRTMRLPFRTAVECHRVRQRRRVVSVDISQGGMLLEDGTGMKLGEELALRFHLPHAPKPVEPQGIAVRKVLPQRLGVQFLSLSSRDRESINNFIAQQTQTALA
jgi:HD domain-containing protein/PilZ domain-containing protein